MNYVVAVSGGVDSVVLLDMLVTSGQHNLTVAHFDHGIREDSAADARFVAALAKKYGLPFVSEREELGLGASEALARRRRYAFLRKLAGQKQATIVTAHHADDIIETIAINIKRGTGWRGLAVFGAKDIARPLLTLTKQAILDYAVKRRLEWVEDSTNKSDAYLRNRLRSRISKQLSAESRERLIALWAKQGTAKQRIEEEGGAILSNTEEFSRYFFTMIPEDTAIELLYQVIHDKTGRTLLGDQLSRGVLAIKTVRNGARVQLGSGVELSFTKARFVAHRGEKVL